ncbi:hypothetical protein PCAR4_300047 [Paraburkholderia caribensis]|nr:hypothetical protein PCAR4_300047 [Paraburkholderia caribensis]
MKVFMQYLKARAIRCAAARSPLAARVGTVEKDSVSSRVKQGGERAPGFVLRSCRL